ncbi:M16 family metallopeptidase [Robertkochia solimangrovi]|uniref:M16 family metallopeptidase n=1 Tax=Robertkochia solimangrovi TaxID=2213046 RepID=UPI00117CE596|nr:M16 family metallopeptidase [Robertkochia solimangrovi]TRZ42849.1 hypothetical protein DMZ48_12325 [Robertkochia solimangrovi]
MKIRKITMLLLFGGMNLFAQSKQDPFFDASVRTGVLENGMTYYIKYNNEPEDRASFYFAQNVGSVLETEKQRGLAHFLEHMAFNGTQNYPDKSMLEYLEKNGIKFGSEINAFTAFDQTVYNISKVPVENSRLMDSTLLILHDWSGFLSLTDEEIDKERGVINEEWRTRNTPSFRANEKVWTTGLLKGSVYADRMPIGLMSVVNNFEYDELRDYYRKWYRPETQAVIVVGDVDVDAMEKKIKEIFSDIPMAKNLPERKVFGMPLKGDFVFIESLDKELGSLNINFSIRQNPEVLKGEAYLEDNLLKSVASYVLNNRFAEYVRQKDCPALSIGYRYSQFVRPLDVLSLSIVPKDGKELESFQFALTELLRFVTFGATESELERAKASIKKGQISYLNNKDKIASDQYASQIYDHYFTGNPMPDIEWSVNYNVNRVETVTNDELLALMKKLYKTEDIVIALVGGESETYPKEKDFKTEFNRVNKRNDLQPYVDKVDDKPLIAESLNRTAIVKSDNVPGFEAMEYELKNGAKVVIYPTDYEKDRIYLSGYSPGGRSLLPIELLPSAEIATAIALQSGLGEYDAVALGKKLAGTRANVSLSLGELSESVSGSSVKSDVEVMFQKLYLSFMAPRFDNDVYDLTMERVEKNLEKKKKNNKSIFSDSLSVALVNHNERSLLFNEDLLSRINFEDMQKIYNDRFANIGDFTFVIMGDIDKDQILDLAAKYIGNITVNGKQETYKDHNFEPAKGRTQVHVTVPMETPQATVNLVLKGEAAYSHEKSLAYSLFGQLLQKLCHEQIREEEGGSYGVGAKAGLSRLPQERFSVSVGFDCNPEKADHLMKLVYDQMDILTSQVNAEDFKEAKESMIKQRREVENNNNYWMSAITSQVYYGNERMDMDTYIEVVNAITKKDIMDIASYITKNSDVVEGLLMPEL